MKHKFLVLYKTGQLESMSKIDNTLTRLVENGVITFIYDIEKNEIKGNTAEGVQDIQVNFIS